MKLTFENLGTNTYLVCEIDEADQIDSMSLGMLTNNSIHGFAPTSFTQMDLTKYLKYNVSAKVSVKQLFSGPVNKKRLIGVFTGVVDAMIAAEDYMIDANDLLLDLDYIFVDVTTIETAVVCLPIENSGRTPMNIGMFFKNIIFNTQFDQTENCDYVAQILNYLNSTAALSLADFKELLDRIASNHPVATAQPKQVADGTANTVATAPAQQPVTVQQPTPPRKPTPPAAPQAPVSASPKQEKTQLSAGTHVPPVVPPVKANPVPQPQGNHQQTEKPMSWLYLLQHYNKENAAIYKAQRDQQKAKRPVVAPPVAPSAQNTTIPKSTGSIAIPGKQGAVSSGIAIPGQQPAMPQQKMAPQPAQQATPAKPMPAQTPEQTTPASNLHVPQHQSARPINFGETTVLGGGQVGETTVLGVSAELHRVEPYLVRVKNNEKIPLNKPVFRIGKERSYVDYFIGDNTAISRSHANIINDNGEYYVVDTNSTNHTYVNGGMIQSNVQTKLSHGTMIRFANEDFEFKMY